MKILVHIYQSEILDTFIIILGRNAVMSHLEFVNVFDKT